MRTDTLESLPTIDLLGELVKRDVLKAEVRFGEDGSVSMMTNSATGQTHCKVKNPTQRKRLSTEWARVV